MISRRGSPRNQSTVRSRANGGARRRSGGTGLSAADRAKIEEAIMYSERVIAALQELLDADDTQRAVKQSWTHAPVH
jgi:hypothetical protein